MRISNYLIKVVNLPINPSVEVILFLIHITTKKNGIHSPNTGYGLNLYFLELSTKNISNASSYLYIVKRNQIKPENGLNSTVPRRYSSLKGIAEFIDYETNQGCLKINLVLSRN